MRIENAFRVDLPPAEAWPVLLDVPAIVPCVPGAELLATEGERVYRGQVKVKLGPVAVTFLGRATFEEVDDANHRARIKATGNEVKGRGSAQATVAFGLVPEGAGSRVTVVTDLALAGAVAQYGRAQGVIADVAQVLVDQFAENLRRRIAATPAADAAPAAAQPAAPAPAAAPALSLFALVLAVLKRWFTRDNKRAVSS